MKFKIHKKQIKALIRSALMALSASIILPLFGSRSPIGKAYYGDLQILSWDYLLEILKHFVYFFPILILANVVVNFRMKIDGNETEKDSPVTEKETKRKKISSIISDIVIVLLIVSTVFFLIGKPWLTSARKYEGRYIYQTYDDWHMKKIDKQKIVSLELYSSEAGTKKITATSMEGSEIIERIVDAFQHVMVGAEVGADNYKGPVYKITFEFELEHIETVTIAGNCISYSELPTSLNVYYFELDGVSELQTLINSTINSDLVKLIIDESTVTNKGLHYKITNYLSSPIITGNPYALYKFENGQWEQLKLKEHTAFTLEGIQVVDEYESDLSFNILAEDLKPGRYKLQKTYGIEDNYMSFINCFCESEFDIS